MILLLLSAVHAVPQITITPNSPTPDESTITCAMNGRVTGYLFTWYLNNKKIFVGNPLTEAVRNGLGITLTPGDTLVCHVQTAQGFVVGETAVTITKNKENKAPTVTITSPQPNANAETKTDVQFTAVATDPENDLVTLSWVFGDGTPRVTGASVTHQFAAAGTFTATVTAQDTHNNQATASVTVIVQTNKAPTVQIITPTANSKVPPNTQVPFTAVAIDPENDPLTYIWNFGDNSPAGAGASTTHSYTNEGPITATVTVTDNHGNSATATVTFTVAKSPSGLSITNLETFKDNAFTQPADLFFRGNPLFVRFKVQDGQGNPVSSLTVSGTVDNPATGAQTVLEYQGSTAPGTYTFQIQGGSISLNDNVLGSNVQVHVQAVQGQETVQAQKIIAIRNNPPIIDVLPTVRFQQNSAGTLALWDFISDKETADAGLQLTIANSPNVQVVIDAQGIATFTATQPGTTQMVLTVDDHDGGVVTQTFTVIVDQRFAPTAVLTVSPAELLTTDDVTFDGSASSDPDGQIVKYVFDFGDGQSTSAITSQAVHHSYTSPGSYRALLTVTDNDGLTGTTAQTVKVTEKVIPPEGLFATGFQHAVEIGSVQLLPFKQAYKAGDTVTFLVKLRNAGRTSELVQVQAYIPGPNSLLVSTQQIKAGDNRLNTDLAWVIPQGTKPGKYLVALEARTANGGIHKREFVSVVVA